MYKNLHLSIIMYVIVTITYYRKKAFINYFDLKKKEQLTFFTPEIANSVGIYLS